MERLSFYCCLVTKTYSTSYNKRSSLFPVKTLDEIVFLELLPQCLSKNTTGVKILENEVSIIFSNLNPYLEVELRIFSGIR